VEQQERYDLNSSHQQEHGSPAISTSQETPSIPPDLPAAVEQLDLLEANVEPVPPAPEQPAQQQDILGSEGSWPQHESTQRTQDTEEPLAQPHPEQDNVQALADMQSSGELDLATAAANIVGNNSALLHALLDTDDGVSHEHALLFSVPSTPLRQPQPAGPSPPPHHDQSFIEEESAAVVEARATALTIEQAIHNKIQSLSRTVAHVSLRHTLARLRQCKEMSSFCPSTHLSTPPYSDVHSWIHSAVYTDDSVVDKTAASSLATHMQKERTVVDPYETDESVSSADEDPEIESPAIQTFVW
jgi:hypothetical protein